MRIVCADSGEVTEFLPCETCEGQGGWDASADCETYDDWHDCPVCGGDGVVEAGND